MAIEITIPRLPIGPNSTNTSGRREPGLLRMHWSRRSRYNKGWAWEIAAHVGGPWERKQVKRHVQIVFYRRRLLDQDNAIASCKPVIDALKKCGIIWDDSPAWVNLDVSQRQSTDQRTDIIVTEIQ